jgi:hypothetical protein
MRMGDSNIIKSLLAKEFERWPVMAHFVAARRSYDHASGRGSIAFPDCIHMQ